MISLINFKLLFASTLNFADRIKRIRPKISLPPKRRAAFATGSTTYVSLSVRLHIPIWIAVSMMKSNTLAPDRRTRYVTPNVNALLWLDGIFGATRHAYCSKVRQMIGHWAIHAFYRRFVCHTEYVLKGDSFIPGKSHGIIICWGAQTQSHRSFYISISLFNLIAATFALDPAQKRPVHGTSD